MIKTASISHRGGRAENEDSVRVCENQNGVCALVADGLGGHGGGQIASLAATERMSDAWKSHGFLTEEQIADAVDHANRTVREKQTDDCEMKTTLVFLETDGQKARWCHVGDSRLYHFVDGKIVERTIDHSVSQLAVLMHQITEDQIRFHADRARILRAVGSSNCQPDISDEIAVNDAGHVFLLCSDGFWEYVYEKEMEECLAKADSPKDWLSGMERLLLERAPENHDNYTAAAVML